MPKIFEILKELDNPEFHGDSNVEVLFPIILDVNNTNPSVIMWVNEKNTNNISNINYGTIICSHSAAVESRRYLNIIKVDNPRNAFRIVLEKFFTKTKKSFIASSAKIAPNVKIGKEAFIGENVVIENDCVIGNFVEINHNSVLYSGTIIGDNVKIGANNTIGGVGFGYEKDQDETYVLIPHLGNVILESNVHIGNNVTIDRAVLGSTLLQENVKVDNLVHIAHGVNIGRNSLIIANAMVAGSCTIGENVWVAPSSSILNKLTIQNNALIGMGAVVVKNVNEGEVIVGNPGKQLQKLNK